MTEPISQRCSCGAFAVECTGAVRLTHGRHCPCSACARQDWGESELAPCGMHGSSCPVYAPIDAPLGSLIGPDGLPLTPHSEGPALDGGEG